MSHNVKPIIIDVGKQKRRNVKQLKAGTGRLVDEVQATVAEVRAATGAAANTQIIPVVVVYERRPRKRRRQRKLGLFGL